jgi:sterol desaturase/sphingolipid hydroxylase (fatty acid hydroxylase superfamily)
MPLNKPHRFTLPILAALLLSLLSFYTHSNIRIPLGPLKYVLNNPQLHIWHHAASIDPRRNVNYGDALCVWDYLLGTAYLPDERPNLKLGFEGVAEYPTRFWGQLIEPFRAIGARLPFLGNALSRRGEPARP